MCSTPKLHSRQDTSSCSLLTRPTCPTEAFQTARALSRRGLGKVADSGGCWKRPTPAGHTNKPMQSCLRLLPGELLPWPTVALRLNRWRNTSRISRTPSFSTDTALSWKSPTRSKTVPKSLLRTLIWWETCPSKHAGNNCSRNLVSALVSTPQSEAMDDKKQQCVRLDCVTSLVREYNEIWLAMEGNMVVVWRTTTARLNSYLRLAGMFILFILQNFDCGGSLLLQHSFQLQH